MVYDSQLRAGMAIRHEGQVHKILMANYHPGQGKMGGATHLRLRNLSTGSRWEQPSGTDIAGSWKTRPTGWVWSRWSRLGMTPAKLRASRDLVVRKSVASCSFFLMIFSNWVTDKGTVVPDLSLNGNIHTLRRLPCWSGWFSWWGLPASSPCPV